MSDDRCVLHLGDCLEVMKGIPDGSIDLILSDLPYEMTACKWDVIIPFVPLWNQYRRVLKQHGAAVLTATQPFASLLATSNLTWFKYEWIWDKSRATGHLNSRKQPLRVTENILIFYREQCTYNPQYRDRDPKGIRRTVATYRSDTDNVYGKGRATRGYNEGRVIPLEKGYPLNLIRIKAMSTFGGAKVHPTQKPVALMEYLIRTYSNEGDTVLDNAMGSGTTGEACLNTGRRFIGIENHPPYFAICESRLTAPFALAARS